MSALLSPAVWPRAGALTRLLHLDPSNGAYEDARVEDLPARLHPGDLFVVNDVATLPASLVGTSRRGPLELRLAGLPEDEPGRWPAVLFGAGSWRQRTEDRPAPWHFAPGERIAFGEGALSAEIVGVSSVSPRLVEVRFDRTGAALQSALHRFGRPVQYSYLCGPLSPWHVQTPYGARPWAVEMPSAGWSLRLPILRALRQRGVGVVSVSHAAGLSSTGDPAIDALLPLPERSDIPAATVEAIADARRTGGRVVAVGTTVVRALEGRAAENGGALVPGSGRTRLRLGPAHVLRVVDGLVTGLHEPGGSHFELLQAFAPRSVLEASIRHAAASGYLGHEFGDLSLILPR